VRPWPNYPQEGGNWWESVQLEGLDPPYRTDFKPKLRNKKPTGVTKQLDFPAPASDSPPTSPKSQKKDHPQTASLAQGKQATQHFMSASDDEMPELTGKLPEAQAPIIPPRVLATWDKYTFTRVRPRGFLQHRRVSPHGDDGRRARPLCRDYVPSLTIGHMCS
jgi:hypothetical protein